MTTHIRNHRSLAALLCVAVFASGACASDPTNASSTQRIVLAQNKTQAPSRTSSKSGGIEFVSAKNSIALLIRDLDKIAPRSIVLMNGIEPSQAGPYEKKKRSPVDWMDQIAADAGMHVLRNPTYDFVFPPGYEVVTQTSITSALDPAFAAKKTTLHIEFGTPLFAALALLSDSLDSTIVADNIVADARCGEIHLHDVTAADVLNALLQSARIPMQSFHVLTKDGTTFLYSAGRPLRDPVHVEAPGESRPEWLDKRVTLYLPSAPAETGHLKGFGSAIPLRDCLAELSRQTGLHFEADARAHALPINPAVMSDLRIETALELIISQWPLPYFGYRANGDTVRFVYLGPPITQ